MFKRTLDRIRLSWATRRLADERGFTMLSAVTSIMVGTLLSLAAWQAANSDIRFTDNDRWSKLAYQYTQTGVSDYVQHMAEASSYWNYCDQPPGFTGDGLGQTALNDTDIGTLAHPKRRWLPYDTAGSAGDRALNGQYTIDLVPANGATSCKDRTPRSLSMIDQDTAVLRVRVTGRAGQRVPATVPDAGVEAWRQQHWTRSSTVIEMRRIGFINYGYFTDHEAQDPDFVGGSVCNTYYQDSSGSDGRWRQSCGELQFANADRLVGPMHTNDSVFVESFGTGGPIFGKQDGDRIEVYNNGMTTCPFRRTSNQDPRSTSSSNCTTTAGGSGIRLATSKVRLVTGPAARYLGLPETDEDLLEYADPNSGDPSARGYTFRGPTTLVIKNDGTFDVTNDAFMGGVTTNLPYPTSGVIYVARTSGAASCNATPDAAYPGFGGDGGCAIAEVSGNYNKSLTIGSQDDIILQGNLTKANQSSVMGLIANDYVRVRNRYGYYDRGCRRYASYSGINDISIDAAILALSRSFTVDAPSCANRGDRIIHLNGSLAQNWRGIVRNGNGYLKDYQYDYNLRALAPPHFLNPTTSTWQVARSRAQVPACICASTG